MMLRCARHVLANNAVVAPVFRLYPLICKCVILTYMSTLNIEMSAVEPPCIPACPVCGVLQMPRVEVNLTLRYHESRLPPSFDRY